MGTTTSVPVHRDDGELVGFLAADGDAWTPCAVFGTPLAPPAPFDDAESILLGEGMAYLARRWELRLDGEWVTVEVLEAGPDRVVVQIVDFGLPGRYGERHERVAPVREGLRPA